MSNDNTQNRYPFLHRHATESEIKELQMNMLAHADRPDKDGKHHLPGDAFAKLLAELWGIKYTNTKASLDVIKKGDFGAEAKLMNHDPWKSLQLRFELMNGTANVWKFIKKHTDFKRFRIEEDQSLETAALLGNALLEFCQKRWADYAKLKEVELSVSKLVAGQLFRREGKEYCQIFTMPLAIFPKVGELQWKFNTEAKHKNKTITLWGCDDQGRRRIEWYCLDNGQLKYLPLIDECSLVSVEFRVDFEVNDRLLRVAREEGVGVLLDRVDRIILGEEEEGDIRTAAQALSIAVRENPKIFAEHYARHVRRQTTLVT